MEVKNCSEFLIQTEINKIHKRVRLIKESLEIQSFDEDKEEIEKIIDDSVESIEKINFDYEKKLKEAKKKFGKIKMKSQSEFEWSQSDSEEVEEIETIQKEIQEKTQDLIEEIIPKKSNSEEVKKIKKNIITSVYDDLTQNAKKLLISALFMTLGYVGVNSMFTNNKQAQNTIEEVRGGYQDTKVGTMEDKVKSSGLFDYFDLGKKKSKKSKDKKTEPKKTEAKKLTLEQITKIESEIQKHKDKGYTILNPDSMTAGEKFDKTKTVFTGGNFPYYLTNKSIVDYDFSYNIRRHLYNKYLPLIDELVEDPGFKMLALSMAYFEGYEPGSESYKTNNPGNIGNTDDGSRKYYKTLEEGVKAQIEHLTKIINDKEPNYPLDKVVSQAPYYSRELKKIVPGFVFVYEGTLEQFLKIYATGPRDHNNYLNAIVTYFKIYFPEANVTAKSKLTDIVKIGRKGSSIKTMVDQKRETKKEKKIK